MTCRPCPRSRRFRRFRRWLPLRRRLQVSVAGRETDAGTKGQHRHLGPVPVPVRDKGTVLDAYFKLMCPCFNGPKCYNYSRAFIHPVITKKCKDHEEYYQKACIQLALYTS